jgi:hypothetical protein
VSIRREWNHRACVVDQHKAGCSGAESKYGSRLEGRVRPSREGSQVVEDRPGNYNYPADVECKR